MQSSLSYTLGANVDNLTLTGSADSTASTVDLNAIPRSGQPNGATGPAVGHHRELLAAAGHSETEAVGFAQGVAIGTDALISVEHVVGASWR